MRLAIEAHRSQRGLVIKNAVTAFTLPPALIARALDGTERFIVDERGLAGQDSRMSSASLDRNYFARARDDVGSSRGPSRRRSRKTSCRHGAVLPRA